MEEKIKKFLESDVWKYLNIGLSMLFFLSILALTILNVESAIRNPRCVNYTFISLIIFFTLLFLVCSFWKLKQSKKEIIKFFYKYIKNFKKNYVLAFSFYWFILYILGLIVYLCLYFLHNLPLDKFSYLFFYLWLPASPLMPIEIYFDKFEKAYLNNSKFIKINLSSLKTSDIIENRFINDSVPVSFRIEGRRIIEVLLILFEFFSAISLMVVDLSLNVTENQNVIINLNIIIFVISFFNFPIIFIKNYLNSNWMSEKSNYFKSNKRMILKEFKKFDSKELNNIDIVIIENFYSNGWINSLLVLILLFYKRFYKVEENDKKIEKLKSPNQKSHP